MINFNILNPQVPKQGPVANLPGQQDSGGIGEVFSGLAGLVKGFKGNGAQPAENAQPAQANATNFSTDIPIPNTTALQNSVASNNIFANAQKNLGLTSSSPILQEYLHKTNPNLDPRVTPWCAGYVGSVLNASGMRGTDSLAAKSYLNFGTPTDKPSMGDIVVLNRGNDPALGHVGFFAGYDKNGSVRILGGNQDKSVSVKSFNQSQVAGYRVPPNGQQVMGFAQQKGFTNPDQLANLPNQMNGQHSELQATMAGIQGVETPGHSNPYTAMGKTTRNGDRAYGKYQIMGNNIPSWTKEATGRSYSPQEFISNPDIQEKTAQYQINKSLQQGYSPQDAASIWFTGRPLDKAGNPSDGHLTNQQYQKEFNKGYLQYKNNKSVPVNNNTGNTKFQLTSNSPQFAAPTSQVALAPSPTRPMSPAQQPGNNRATNPQVPIRNLNPGEIDWMMRNLHGDNGQPGILWNLLNNQNVA